MAKVMGSEQSVLAKGRFADLRRASSKVSDCSNFRSCTTTARRLSDGPYHSNEGGSNAGHWCLLSAISWGSLIALLCLQEKR